MLTASAILQAIRKKEIIIDPFDEKNLNPNSYNVHLGPILKAYNKDRVLDPKSENRPDFEFLLKEEGTIIYPGHLYIGNIVERVATNFYISAIDGRSSIGRLGLQIHATAGFGDIGFDGHYTLEIIPTIPIRVYPGLSIGQVYFEKPDGDVDFLYNGRYQHQVEPTTSRIYIKDEDLNDGYFYKSKKEEEK